MAGRKEWLCQDVGQHVLCGAVNARVPAATCSRIMVLDVDVLSAFLVSASVFDHANSGSVVFVKHSRQGFPAQPTDMSCSNARSQTSSFAAAQADTSSASAVLVLTQR